MKVSGCPAFVTVEMLKFGVVCQRYLSSCLQIIRQPTSRKSPANVPFHLFPIVFLFRMLFLIRGFGRTGGPGGRAGSSLSRKVLARGPRGPVSGVDDTSHQHQGGGKIVANCCLRVGVIRTTEMLSFRDQFLVSRLFRWSIVYY